MDLGPLCSAPPQINFSDKSMEGREEVKAFLLG
jgi:hypothetical protein